MKFSEFSKSLISWRAIQAADDNVDEPGFSKITVNLMALEDRVLYSAAPLPVDLINAVDVQQFEQFDLVETVDHHLDIISKAVETLVADDHLYGDLSDLPLELSQLNSNAQSETQPTLELIVVDVSVDDYGQLVENLVRQAGDERSYDVVYVDSQSNGISQVSDYLAGNNRLFNAIHLVTHGSDGQIHLGDSVLNQSSLSTFANQLATWNASLVENADLLIYGCHVAETEFGEFFVDELAQLIGVDVAASDNITGHFDLSGDWNFEYRVGIIESTIAFTEDVQASWQHDLAVATLDGSSEDGSASRAVAASDSGDFVGVFSTNTIAGSVGTDIYYELHTQQDLIDGNPATAIRVNDTLTGDQQWATVAMAANGDMTFVWTSDHSGQLGVYGKILDSTGSVIQSEFQIDQGNGGHNASIAMDQLGNFVVVWESSGDGDVAGDIYGQMFDAFGNTVDSTFQVNTGEANGGDTSGYQGRADVAMNESNQFIVSWDNYFDSDTESEIFANKYEFNASTVTSLSDEFLVQGTISTQLLFSSSVDINDSGDFVVAWTGDSSDSLKAAPFGVGAAATALSTQVQGSTFLANGTLVHNFTLVNNTAQGAQEHPSVALLDSNVVVFVWEGESGLSSDPDGVYQRRFSFYGTEIDANERLVSPLADTGVQTNVSIAKYLDNNYAIGFTGILDGTDGYQILATTAQAMLNVPEGLVYSTAGSGSQGSSSWGAGDALGFGDPALTFGSPTDGQAYVVFVTPYNLNAIHVVTQETTIDTLTPTVLNVGDIMFSIDEEFTTAMPGVGAATDEDILIFRPSSPGNYDFASGTVSVLTTLSGTDDIQGLTLVQTDTTIGDYDLVAGDILFTSILSASNEIKLLRTTGGVPTIDILIDGLDVGIDEPIMGIDLIEEQTTIGGMTLNAGTLLLSAERNETVGAAGVDEVAQSTAGGLTIQDNDIYALEFSTTTLGITGTANATASMFFDASTVSGLSGGPSGDVDAISLVTTPSVNVEESLDINDVLIVDEGTSRAITNAELLTTDANDASADLVYTITSAPAYGTILLSGSPTLTFTQDDIDSGRVSYQHDGTDTTSDSFDFSVDDGQGTNTTDTFVIVVNPINDNPAIAVNTGMSVSEGQSNAVISAAMLSIADDDDGPGELTFTIVSSPANGTLYLDAAALTDGNQFTQADINSGRLSYRHDGSETDFDSFLFYAIDGGEDGTVAQVGTFDIAISEVNDAPTDLTSGVQLNMDGGNDAYFEAGVGDILAGLNEFTLEMTFSAQFATKTPLFSYETAAGDDVEVVLKGDGSLHLKINNTSAGTLTGIDYNTLMDGSIVNFAFSWDNANGAWAVMVDGVVTDSGNGLNVGQTLASGGRLIFGIDQDSPGGGFRFDEIFSGTFHDVRLWNEFRTAEEILVNKDHKFDADNIPPGLIANWQMTDLIGGTTIVDLINPGTNDLNLGHASGANFVASTPTDSLNVDENSVNGTVVGHVMPTDVEYRDDIVIDGMFLDENITLPSFTSFYADGSGAGSQLGPWSVIANVIDVRGSAWESSPLGGRVVDLSGGATTGQHGQGIIEQTLSTVVGQEYEITFAMTGNFEGPETQHRLSVNIDGATNVFSCDEPVGWTRNNLQWTEETISFTANSTATVLQFQALTGTTRGAMIGDVRVVESSTAGNGVFSFDMTNNAGGRFAIDSLTGEITVANQNGLNYEANTVHTVTIEVTDSAGDSFAQNIDIYINDVNEAPTLPVNNGITVSLASTGSVITSSMLNANDVDASDIPAELTYTIDSIVSSGTLWLSGVELFNGDSFTQQDINDGNLTYDHNGATVGDSFDFTLSDGGEDGATNVAGTFAIGLIPVEVSGRVLEDANGDADLSDATGVEDAVVYLYRDNGDNAIGAGDVLVNVQLTNVDGQYTFGGLQHGQTYWVVVDSKTIQSSSAINSGYSFNDAWAQQTYGDGGAKFGGLDAGVSDDASTLQTAQHISRIDVTGDETDIDFGFSFNVVTNTLGGDAQDDDAGANQRSVQGSLRQFMTNANAIDGDNNMRFVPVEAANRSAGTDAWWEISVSRALPAITDEGTTIDGRAYLIDGVTLSNSNSSTLGYVGSVGVGADGVAGTGDEMFLTGLDAPELQISDVAGVAKGITVNASNVEISYISIQGFGRSGFSSGNIFVEAAGEYVYIHHNIIGAEADSFGSPPTAASQFVNIQVEAADHGLIADNLIGFSAGTGIEIAGTSNFADDAYGWTITGNEIRSNGLVGTAKDGIDLQYDVIDISIVGNLIAGNAGYGIDSWRGSGGYTIADNTIFGNGIGGDETGGIRLFGSGSEVQHNLITNNTGAGVNIVGDYSNGSTTFTAATGNLVTQNSFSGNSGNSIDLMSSTNVPTILEQGDGVSANGFTSDIGAGNQGLDYPELNYVEFQAGQLLIAGRISPSLNIDRIEFYLASVGAGDSWSGQSYGEGQTYLGTLSVSSLTLDGVTGEFSGILPPPFPGAFALNPVGQQITAIAIDTANNTSEFGNNFTPNVAPTAVDSNILMDEDSVHIFDKLEFGFLDTSGDSLERVRIDSLPAVGTLFLNGIALTTTGVEISVAQLDAGNLSYQPNLDSNGLPLTTFNFSVHDGDTYSSASASLEVHVTPVNDQPTGTGESFSTAEDALLVVDLSSPENLLSNISDVDGDSLTVITTPITGPANGTLLLGSDGTFSYLPDPNFNGSDSFMYEVVDGNGGSIVATATISITPVNNDPVLTDPGVVNVAENTNHVVNLNSTDVDGDSLTYSIAGTGSDDAQFDMVGNELVFLVAPDFESPLGSFGNTYFVDVRVDDGNSGFAVRTIEVVVTDVMDNPEGFDDTFWVDEAGLYTSTTSVLDNDLDRLGSGLTASILVHPTHGSISMNPDGTLAYQHDGSETTIDNFQYVVVGADGQLDTAEVTINVNPIQDPTIANNDGIFAVAPDETVVVTAAELLANDVDPDSTNLRIVLVDSPVDGVAFIDANGNLVFDPGASFFGLEVLEYVVVADGITSNVATVTFDVLSTVGIPPVDVIEPEDETPDNEISVNESPPPSDGGSTSMEDVGDVPLTSFADSTADTVQSESSAQENDSNDLDFELERQQTTYAYANDTNNLSLENAVGFGRLTAASGLAISKFDPVMAGIFWNDLDAAKEEFLLKFDLTTPTIVASVTSFLTVGYLAWIVRGGVLLTTFMSSVPAWQAFDPLPVIESAAREDDDDDQSIAQMIDSK